MAEYIEREAISEEIRKFYYKNPPNFSYGEGFDRGLDRAQRAILDAPAADVAPVQKWIPVTERLPEEKVDCIVHYKHAYCDTDDYWAIGFCFYDGEKFKFDPAYKVTHWMPMPEPPKEE